MKKYFKFVGSVELVLRFIGLIAFIMYMAIGGSSHTIVTNGVKVTVPAFISEGYQWFMVIILFLFYIVIGPALGALFLNYGSANEQNATNVNNPVKEAKEISSLKNKENDDREEKYNKALKLFSLSRYDEAKQLFLELKGYRNSERFASVCDYKSTHSK